MGFPLDLTWSSHEKKVKTVKFHQVTVQVSNHGVYSRVTLMRPFFLLFNFSTLQSLIINLNDKLKAHNEAYILIFVKDLLGLKNYALVVPR